MKRTLSLIMVLALLAASAVLPALAEGADGSVDQISSATQQSGQPGTGGHPEMPGNGRMPGNGQRPGNRQNPGNGQMPGNEQTPGNGQIPQMPENGQAPAMPENGQVPSVPDNGQAPQSSEIIQEPVTPAQDDQNTGNSPDGQNRVQSGKHEKNERGGKRGNRSGSRDANTEGNFRQRLDFDQMLKDGVITQEVYDTIMSYMKDRSPQQQDDSAGAESAEPPALPDTAGGEPAGMEEDLLKELLDGGMITQEQYDQLLTKLGTPEPEAES